METRGRELTPDLFERTDFGAGGENERIAGPPIGFWRDSWIRLRKNRGALVGLAVVALLILLAFTAPFFTPYGSGEQDVSRRFQGPSAEFWFGTDEFGRDMFARVWEGTRVSLYIGFLAALLDLVVGVTFGAVSGIVGGRTDGLLQRVIEVLNSIPYLVVAILALLLLDPGILTVTVAIGLTSWTYMARLVRGRVLQLKGQEFALAAQSLGAGRFRLLTRHLIPNSLGLIIINLMFTIPLAIFAEAFLSFIGLGIQPPEASLGSLINDGFRQLRFFPYLLFIPALIFSLLMIFFNLLADGLRDAFDPRLRR